MGGIHELPSKQMDYVGRGGGHRPDCARRIVRLAGRRDADLSGRVWQATSMRALTIALCLLATPAPAGAAQVLGPDHGVTKALARASITMDKVDMWRARLAVKTLRRDQREAIAAATEE